MYLRTFIISLLLMAAAAWRADAQTTCSSVDDVWHSLSVVRDIEAKPKSRNYAENIAKLDALADKIFLPSLITPDFQQAFPDDNEKLFSYVAQIRQVVSGANAGHHDYSRKTLSGLTSNNFAESMLLLQNHLGCAPGQFAESLYPFLAENSKVQANLLTDSGLANIVDSLPQDPGKAGADKSRANQQNFAASDGKEDPLLLLEILLLILVITVVSMFVADFFIKRRRLQIKREERHFCNLPTQVRLGRNIHAATILDVTMNGMKIQHFGAIKHKRFMRILIDGHWYKLQVRRLDSSFAGVQFKRPVSAETLQLILNAATSPDPAANDNMREAA